MGHRLHRLVAAACVVMAVANVVCGVLFASPFNLLIAAWNLAVAAWIVVW